MTWLLPKVVEVQGPIAQGVWGTCFTWFVTALGSSLVFLVPEDLSESAEGKFLDACLGFAAGVMLAASYWSLLAPSIEMAEDAGFGEWSFVPAAVGFLLGAAFVFLADLMLPEDSEDPMSYLQSEKEEEDRGEDTDPVSPARSQQLGNLESQSNLRSRKGKMSTPNIDTKVNEQYSKLDKTDAQGKAGSRSVAKGKSWRRLVLLVIAVTIHNFPEGLAVGVGFGAVGRVERATLKAAEILTFGIGIQNFPEGLAVSLPMRRMGYSKFWCFFYGQLSGMVEPLGGFLGAAAVQFAEPLLPYALAFAAGAMVYVVVDSIVPEAQTRGNSKMATWGSIFGFLVMMTLDVALG